MKNLSKFTIAASVAYLGFLYFDQPSQIPIPEDDEPKPKRHTFATATNDPPSDPQGNPTDPTSNPDGTASGSLVDSANKHIGTSTANIPGTDGGNLGCAAAVSMMFKDATGQNILPGKPMVLGTEELYSGLSNDSRFVKVPLGEAQPGDIVVTAQGSQAGHTGIVVNNGRIISNSSSGYNGSARGTIQNNYSIQSWQNTVTPRNANQTSAFRYIGNQ